MKKKRDCPQFSSVYNLLPSEKYFKYVDDPVITFDDSQLLASWRIKYGEKINSSISLSNFLTDTTRETLLTKETLNNPPILRSLLFGSAENLHNTVLDSWIPPHGVRVSEIVGWGEMTAKTIEYKQGTMGVCLEWNYNNTCKRGEQRPTLEYESVAFRQQTQLV